VKNIDVDPSRHRAERAGRHTDEHAGQARAGALGDQGTTHSGQLTILVDEPGLLAQPCHGAHRVEEVGEHERERQQHDGVQVEVDERTEGRPTVEPRSETRRRRSITGIP
jgi:hypothetical protein